MNKVLKTLPKEIKSRLQSTEALLIDIGESKSDVFKVQLMTGEEAYLKHSSMAYVATEIETEAKILRWLAPHLAVPRVIEHFRRDNEVFFLMSAVPGINLAEYSQHVTAEECMILGARYLRKIHSVSTSDCSFYRGLSMTLKEAEKNFRAGLIDETDFDVSRLGLSAEQVFTSLVARVPKNEDLVFTHGDYCFPNIIIHKNQVSGIVDLGRAGVADRYQDIALFLRSFKFNTAEPDLDLFLKEYSLIPTLDFEKIEFYKALDEFF